MQLLKYLYLVLPQVQVLPFFANRYSNLKKIKNSS
jgi:hypothetical protein